MPLFWPFKSKNTLAYEKELVQLSTRIADKQRHISVLRLRLRRVKGLVSLYAIILYIIFLSLWIFNVIPNKSRYQNLATIVLSPFAIWALRYAIQACFSYLLRSNSELLDNLLLKRNTIVEELKEKTGFYSTQALLQRFDAADTGTAEHVSGAPDSKVLKKPKRPDTTVDKSHGIGVEPLDQSLGSAGQTPGNAIEYSQAAEPLRDPSVKPSHAQAQVHVYKPQWYDKILELLVGEDELSPKNRYALICANCRSHNGLARYGEFPEYVVYRCPSCGYVNGRERELEEKIKLVDKEESGGPSSDEGSQSLADNEDNEGNEGNEGDTDNEDSKDNNKGTGLEKRHRKKKGKVAEENEQHSTAPVTLIETPETTKARRRTRSSLARSKADSSQ